MAEHEQGHEHEHGMTKKKYWVIFAWLMILLFLTVFVAYMHINPTLAIIVAMTIAIVKATLVVLYFMHVRYNSKLTWVFVGSGFVWLLIMIGITMTDYVTRDMDGGYSTVEQTYSSPYGLPAKMYPQNQPGAAGHGEHGGGHGAEDAHGETKPAQEKSGH